MERADGVICCPEPAIIVPSRGLPGRLLGNNCYPPGGVLSWTL